MSGYSMRVVLGIGTTLALATAVHAQPPKHEAGARNMSAMKFAPVPGLPTCAQAALQKGDPAATGFIVLVKATTGCTVPWHWHTYGEQIMLVSGTGEVTMRDDGKPVELKPGGFASMPGKHVHQFRCKQACTFFLNVEGKFDIHYVDRDGNEIPPKTALAPYRQTVATAPGGSTQSRRATPPRKP